MNTRGDLELFGALLFIIGTVAALLIAYGGIANFEAHGISHKDALLYTGLLMIAFGVIGMIALPLLFKLLNRKYDEYVAKHGWD